MSRKKACGDGEGIKKGAWTTEEDKKLISYIHEHGEGGWRDIPKKAGLKRYGKSCRLRWANYLKPYIKKGEFSNEEEQIIIMLHASCGNKWSVIARHLPKRTDKEVKNYWNTHLKQRLIDQGLDPVTHKPLVSNPSSATLKTSEFQSLIPSSSSNLPEISSSDETPGNDSSLSSKKLFCKRSKLLNKVATRASSIGNLLSASMEGTLVSSTTLPTHLNDEFSDTSQFQIGELDQFFESSEHIINDHMKEDYDMNFDLNNLEYDFSQFLEEFSNNEGEETENIGGYNQDPLISDVSLDEDNMMLNLSGWSDYLVDSSDLGYETNQDCNEKNFI